MKFEYSKSSVELIDYMGTDVTVADAARVSFNRRSSALSESTIHIMVDGVDTEIKIPDLQPSDKNLIKYLAEHNHWTPFGHPMITMRETVPLIVARQRFKHTVGFVYNEVSRRYVNDDFAVFQPNGWRAADTDKKQGSKQDEFIQYLSGRNTGIEVQEMYEYVIDTCFEAYEAMIDSGVCPEQARLCLPQGMMTSYYVTGSLAAWSRAYHLRNAPDAQLEIRELAPQWKSILDTLFPVSSGYLLR